jgi:hypothetical protein
MVNPRKHSQKEREQKIICLFTQEHNSTNQTTNYFNSSPSNFSLTVNNQSNLQEIKEGA